MSKQTEFEKVAILGVEIDAISVADAVAYVATRAKTGPAGYAVKPYVEFLDQASRSEELRLLINGADLAIADGISIVWAAAYLYAGPRTLWRLIKTLSQIVLSPHELLWPLPDRAAGTNFTWPLLQRAATDHLSVFLIGTPQSQSIETTANYLQHHIAGINLAGTAPGDASAEATERLVARLGEIKPDLILVGMGWPLQERLMASLVTQLEHGFLIGEGGTFDYELFGGSRPKAPSWLQRVGLEWLWRLIIQPSRWRRQLAIPRFIGKIWRSR